MATVERNALLIEARTALRRTYVHDLSPVEKLFLEALSKLTHALEADVTPNPPFDPAIKTEEDIDLEALYERLTPRVDTSAPDQPKFVISFADMELSLEEIWPEGNAPENPTPEDVIDVMRGVEHAHPSTVAAKWLLIDTLFVRHNRDENGDMEVEWDGT